MSTPSSSSNGQPEHRNGRPLLSNSLKDGPSTKGDDNKSIPAKPWTRKNPLAYNMQSILARGKALLTPSGSNASLSKSGFTTVKDAKSLFAQVDPTVDGDDCLHDCSSCTVTLPRKWSIDEDDTLYGHVNGWESHVIVATGKTDWVRDITDEKGSLMEKIGQISNSGKQMEFNGRSVMLSASDLPTSSGNDNRHDHDHGYPKNGRTTCLVLPGWKMVEGVGTSEVEWMMREVVSKGASNVTAIKKENVVPSMDGTSTPDTEGNVELNVSKLKIDEASSTSPRPALGSAISSLPPPEGVNLKSCPHRAIILMCSHKTRDWRCGASAPLLRSEFERHLRPLGLYRDIHDERPGGVGIYFINHVGGHKYSANVMIYRREGRKVQQGEDGKANVPVLNDEAVQGIWLARVRPEDCENIVKYTVLQGKLVKPQKQLRGGFDREAGLISW